MKANKILFLAITLICSINACAHFNRYLPNYLSESSEISYIACEPGDEAYTVFGHAAIRVFDPINQMDICAHWGIFDYASDNFFYRFVKGNAKYEMGIYPTDLFFMEYKTRGSTVYEAVLNLGKNEKQKIYDLLLENYKPENKKYKYNYVRDNCATRPINLILNNTNSIIPPDAHKKETTFRKIISNYAKKGSILSIAIDLVVGSEADKKIENIETSAFPIIALKNLENTKIITDNKKTNIVKETYTAFKGKDRLPVTKSPFRFIYFSICIIASLLLLSLFIIKDKIPKILFSTAYILSSLIGVTITFLMLLSDHPLVDYNWNILWLNPLNLILIFAIFSKPNKTWLHISMIFIALSFTAGIIYLLSIQCPSISVIGIWALHITINILTSTYLHKSINSSDSK